MKEFILTALLVYFLWRFLAFLLEYWTLKNEYRRKNRQPF